MFSFFYLAGELCRNVLIYQDKIFTGVGLCKRVLKWIQLVTKTQGEWAILGIFFPTDNALYSRAFGTHTKTAIPIDMPFGWVLGTICQMGDSSPQGEGAIFGENVAPLCEVMGPSTSLR